MFKVRAETAVFRDRGPIVFQNSYIGLADVDHRLDGEHHALAQAISLAGSAVIRDLRIFVQARSNAVSHELAHHAKAVGFHMLLHRGADVAQRIADADLLNRPRETS